MKNIILLFLISLFIPSAYAKDTELRGQIWFGNASWYGTYFHGRKTSSGEKYNKNRLTAAHRTLPFNTRVKITNLKTNKSVVVRVNDRGPFRGDRIIDISEKAAKKIHMRESGIAYVKVQVLRNQRFSIRKITQKISDKLT